jgi:hypothetical protein
MYKKFALIVVFIAALLVTNHFFKKDKKVEEIAQPVPEIPTRVTLVGEYICLPHRGVKPGEPQTAECASGLKTDEGKIYALSAMAASKMFPSLFPGDRISAEGVVTPVTPDNKELYRYEADHLFSVTNSLEIVTVSSNGALYSSDTAIKEVVVNTPKPGDKVKLPITVTGYAKSSWFSEGAWGPKGTIRLQLLDENNWQIAGEATGIQTGKRDAEGRLEFKGTITLGEHTQSTTGYITVMQSNIHGKREFVKVPIIF